jgi:hypothetical protein
MNEQRALLRASAPLSCLIAVLTLGLALAAHPAAAAQVDHLEIVIKDVASGEELGAVEPGDTVTIADTAKVRLIMSVVLTDGRAIYPYTTFSCEEGGARITRANPDNGTADLNLAQASGDVQEVGFAIDDERVPGEISEGSFGVRVGH